MAKRWKFRVTQVGSSYSVEDIRRIIGSGVGIVSGSRDQPVFQFNFDSEASALAADAAIAVNTSGLHTRVDPFDTARF
jgi:hypothetical protein